MPNHAIPGHFRLHRIKTNRNPTRFSSDRVGAYYIRPTNGHAGGRTDRKIAIFQVGRVGRNSIRLTNGHARGRMKLIPIRFLIYRLKTNQNPVHFSVHLAICMTICGAYAIRPYTDTRKNDDYFIPRIKTNRNPVYFSARPTICMVVYGAYAIRPYTGT